MTIFLEAMLRDLSDRFVVVWDGGPMHKGEPIRPLEAQFADWLILEMLPPWAPMLNPVEPLWSWLKWERVSNFAPHDVHEPDARVIAELASKRDDQAFLRNLFHALGLGTRSLIVLGSSISGLWESHIPAARIRRPVPSIELFSCE